MAKCQESKTSKRRIAARERWTRALELRKRGLIFEKIGEQMGCSRQMAHNMVSRALAELREKCHEEAEAVRELELQRLDEMFVMAFEQVEGGKLDAIDRALRIMDRRAKLLGLDAPTKVAPTDPSGSQPYESLTDDERADRLAALFERARARRDGQAADDEDAEAP